MIVGIRVLCRISIDRFYMTRVRRISFCVLILGFLAVSVVLDALLLLSNTAGRLFVVSPI